MPEFFSRDEWGARPPKPGPGTLDPDDVIGMAVHWPAITAPIRGVKNVMAAIRGWQNFHMDDRGWSDLAYQQTIDQDGNRYQGRGLRTQSGANGNDDVNDEYGALLLVLAPGEKPSPAMMSGAHRVIRRHRILMPNSRFIRGHGQIRPGGTTCPGPIVQDLIDAGKFEPPPAWTPVLLRRRVTRALAEAEEAPDKTPNIERIRLRLQRTLNNLERINS